MKRTIQHALVLSVAAIALAVAAACGGGKPTTAQPPSGSLPNGVDCSDPNLPMDVWTANCSGATPPEGTPPGETGPEFATASVGQPFPQFTESSSTESAEPTGIELSMTVRVLKCGISSFPIEPAPGVGAPGPASPGNQFCRATVTIKNDGDAPISDGISLDETTITANGKSYAADQLSQDIVSALNQEVYDRGGITGFFAGEVVNPGATATQVRVWQIPASASVDSVDFTSPPTQVKTH